MLLETHPIQQQAANENITSMIANSASSAIKPLLSEIWKMALPIIEILGGILVLYIVYKIISSITNHLLRKRVKQIDKNVQELQKKTDEILTILKSKKGKVSQENRRLSGKSK